jgi:type II secretory ATPase GspE/PulE/Tfp pilus assembly ATPase PilB-like protein
VCARSRLYGEDEIASLGLTGTVLATERWYGARGCDTCSNAGYLGRTVAAEVLTLTPEIKEMIVDRRSTAELRLAAVRNGLREMREAALAKARAGVTSLQEVVRVT